MSEKRENEIPGVYATRRWIAFWKMLGSFAWLILVLAFFREPMMEASGPLQNRLPEWSQFGQRSFMLGVVTRPGGGRVAVAGVDRGASPVLVNVECKGDEPVPVEVTMPGFKTWTQNVPCQKGGSFEVEARLER